MKCVQSQPALYPQSGLLLFGTPCGGRNAKIHKFLRKDCPAGKFVISFIKLWLGSILTKNTR